MGPVLGGGIKTKWMLGSSAPFLHVPVSMDESFLWGEPGENDICSAVTEQPLVELRSLSPWEAPQELCGAFVLGKPDRPQMWKARSQGLSDECVFMMIWAHPYSSSLALSLWQIRLCTARPVLGTHIVVEFSFGKRNLYSNVFTMESTFGCLKFLHLHHHQSASIVVLLSLLVFLFLLFFSPHLFNTCLFLPHNPRPRVCHHSIYFIVLFFLDTTYYGFYF